jgi:hypothetical protein
VCQSRGP